MIVLPGPVLLADPLPDGWRRCHALGCGEPAGHDGAHVAERVPPARIAPSMPVSPQRCACALGPDLACPEHGADLAHWVREHGR